MLNSIPEGYHRPNQKRYDQYPQSVLKIQAGEKLPHITNSIPEPPMVLNKQVPDESEKIGGKHRLSPRKNFGLSLMKDNRSYLPPGSAK